MPRRLLPGFLILCLMLLSSCSTVPVWDGKIAVTMVDSPYIDFPEGQTFLTIRHQDLEIALVPHKRYTITSVDYPSYELIPESNRLLLVLKNVSHPTRVEISCQIADASLTYDTNGGTCPAGTSYQEFYSLSHHLRPNTSQGLSMEREGFILTGWNTKPDGSGEECGLGSRFTASREEAITLYAQWKAFTPASDFVFSETEDGMELMSCTGSDTVIAVPEMIDGKAVVSVAESAFTSCPAREIILPPTITSVADGAFRDCALKELTFSDSLIRISDSSFVDCPDFTTVHINAVTPPRYASFDRHSTYADKVDLLILHQNEKKIVLFGGSGTFYSVNAAALSEAVSGYEAYNLGINAWFNVPAQLEIILPYMKEDDILLHIPEMKSEYQFLAKDDMGCGKGRSIMDTRFFMCMELNYDLLSYINLQDVTSFFDTYAAYAAERQSQPGKSYADFTTFATVHGDYQSYRLSAVEKIGSISGEAGLDPTLLSPEYTERLNGYYKRFADQGCTVLRAFACVNRDGFTEEDWENLEVFEEGFISASPYPVINQLSEVLLPTTCFCDTDWHLTYEWSLENTALLVPGLLPYISGAES